MPPDYAVCALAARDTVRIIAARTTALAREGQRRHDCSPTVTAALGRLLTAAVLMSISLKRRERITLQIDADGPVGGLIADALPDGRVRGYPRRPRAELPLNSDGKFDVGGIVGRGTLHVTRLFENGQPYTSAVRLATGEIGDDLAAYFARSEQTPSVVAVGVLADRQGVVASGGLLAQLLPGAGEDAVDALEKAAGAFPQISTLVREGLSPEEIVLRFAGSLSPRMTHVQPVSFRCTCDRARVARALIGLGREQLADMAASQHDTEATCEFCAQRFYFSAAEIASILEDASAAV
ncbi:MAG: Hsp33 family molecular chaperone HslO [Candidatus Eremiobacteraeota bacterium]|nr:Hsp33 family molecular chaperone HslO [Candidatus Eremiobacteraeota bacterium]